MKDRDLYPPLEGFVIMMNGHTGNDDEVCTRLLENFCTSSQLIQRTRTFALDS
jgi:hypothetical protein